MNNFSTPDQPEQGIINPRARRDDASPTPACKQHADENTTEPTHELEPPAGEPPAEDPFAIVFFGHKLDRVPQPARLTWAQLTKLLTRHRVRTDKDGPAFSPMLYRPGCTRGNEGVESVSLAVLDFDGGVTLDELRAHCAGLTVIVYSTFSHDPDQGQEKYRLVIPLSRPVPAAQWPGVWNRLQARFGGLPDRSAKDAASLFYLPACPPERQAIAVAEAWNGIPLDPDTLPDPLPTSVAGHSTSALPLPAPSVATPPVLGSLASGARYVQVALERELGELSQTLNGGRNNRLNRAAFALGQLVGAGGLERAVVEEQLTQVALAIGLPPAEVAATVRSGLGNGILQPRYIPPPRNGCSGSGPVANSLAAKTAATMNGVASAPDQLAPDQPAPLKATPGFSLDDIGNGQRFAAQHGESVRFCPAWESWLVYDGKRWQRDARSELEQRAKATARSIAQEALLEPDEDRHIAILKHAAASCRRARRETMLQDAASEEGIPICPNQLDTDPWLLNVLNGTLDLRSGQLHLHDPGQLLSRLAPVLYDPAATCPRFEAFLQTTLGHSSALIECVQRALGYALSGVNREQVAFFFHGGGSNGKSTLLETVVKLMGDYAWEVEPDSIMIRRHERIAVDIADLFNVRLLVTSESNDTQRLDEAKVKKMTGERKFEHPFKFWPRFKLFLGTNHLPEIRGTDRGIWRRLICVPFDTVYWRADKGESGPPELQADLGLEETLRGEFSGILNWLLEGCRQWQQHGLSWPPEVQARTNSYRREQDALGQFLAGCCVTGPGHRASSRELSQAYATWCHNNDATPLSDGMLGKQLRERGFAKHDTKKERGWAGLSLQEEFKAGQDDDAPAEDSQENVT